MPEELKTPKYLVIATVQKVVTTEILYGDHGDKLFTQLKEMGSGMHIVLWSDTFKKPVATHIHRNHPSHPNYAK